MSEPLSDEERLQKAKDLADDMLLDEAYEWATDTVQGIRDTIERTGRCSERQYGALCNIDASVRKR
jgi:hypothetical protein